MSQDTPQRGAHERDESKHGIGKMIFSIVAATAVVFAAAFFLGWYFAGAVFDAGKLTKTVVGLVPLFFLGKLWWRYILVLKSEMTFYVPQNCFAIRKLFGGRLAGYIAEGGPYYKFPDVIEIVDHYSTEPVIADVKATITTRDDLTVEIEGKLQYVADPNVVDENGRVIFTKMSDDTISVGISKDIESKLGGIGGLRNKKDLTDSRQALSKFFNQNLRSSVPFHLRHIGCQEPKCPEGLRDQNQISAKDIISFYNAHWVAAKAITDNEQNIQNDKSSTEIRYGIDIITFTISRVGFDEETRKALGAAKRAELRSNAFKRTVLPLAKKAVKELAGISPDTALNAAQAATDPVVAEHRHIIATEGKGGAQPIVVLGGLGNMGTTLPPQSGGNNTGSGGTPPPYTPRKKGGRR